MPNVVHPLKVATVRVPGSTSNLGAGFDCFGLALQLYLTVKANIRNGAAADCVVQVGSGKENAGLSLDSDNLVYRAMSYAAEREAVSLPSVQLNIDNEIPISRGLGGSAAAIIAGIRLFDVLCQRALSSQTVLQYATEIEGHADNAAPSLLGGFVVNCVGEQGQVISLRRPWPADIKVIAVVPELHLETKLARAALPVEVNHRDAVFNLQHAALFEAALSEQRLDLLWEAMQDRLHQEKRSLLVPGLAQALATPRMPGLIGVALSGAGPTVLGLATDNFTQVGSAIAAGFENHGVKSRVLELEIDTAGCQTEGPNAEGS